MHRQLNSLTHCPMCRVSMRIIRYRWPDALDPADHDCDGTHCSPENCVHDSLDCLSESAAGGMHLQIPVQTPVREFNVNVMPEDRMSSALDAMHITDSSNGWHATCTCCAETNLGVHQCVRAVMNVSSRTVHDLLQNEACSTCQ